MNRLEQFISEHKNLFEEEPLSGHYERLLQKRGSKSKHILRFAVSVAASIAIVVSVGILWLYDNKQEDSCAQASDIKICYLNKMNALALSIEKLVVNFDPCDQQQVMGDVQNIMEAVYNGFESEIADELPDDMVEEVLGNYFRQNLEGLERIEKLIKN